MTRKERRPGTQGGPEAATYPFFQRRHGTTWSGSAVAASGKKGQEAALATEPPEQGTV